MFRAIKRLFIWMGLMAEKATETDAINEAVVERGIRDSKAKADKAHYANGQLAGQIALLKRVYGLLPEDGEISLRLLTKKDSAAECSPIVFST